MKKWVLPFALITAVVYVTLSVSAAACLFAHQNQARTTHHHTGSATHSSLCAWACQANQTIDLPATVPHVQPYLLIALLPSVESSTPSLFAQHAASSRASPQL